MFSWIALGLVTFMGLYFLVNPSYQKSLEAKYYYELGEYDSAYALASEAFSLDVYNRMASTVMAQSKTSLKYVEYIHQAQEFLEEINEIAKAESISDASRAKIKIMSEIMVGSYVKLAPSIITDSDLVARAAKYHDDFEKLLAKVTR